MRLDGWPERLIAAIELQRRAPFCWGAADCATLFGAAVEALTGRDPLAAFRPWRDEVTAARALAKSGARSVEDFVGAILSPVAPSAAARGDFGYIDGAQDRLQFPAVIIGAEAVSRDRAGWVIVPRRLIVRAYTVDTQPAPQG